MQNITVTFEDATEVLVCDHSCAEALCTGSFYKKIELVYNINLLVTVFLVSLIARQIQENIKNRDKIIAKPHKSDDLQILKYAVCFPHLFSVQLQTGQVMPPTEAEVKECRNRIIRSFVLQILQ